MPTRAVNEVNVAPSASAVTLMAPVSPSLLPLAAVTSSSATVLRPG